MSSLTDTLHHQLNQVETKVSLFRIFGLGAWFIVGVLFLFSGLFYADVHWIPGDYFVSIGNRVSGIWVGAFMAIMAAVGTGFYQTAETAEKDRKDKAEIVRVVDERVQKAAKQSEEAKKAEDQAKENEKRLAELAAEKTLTEDVRRAFNFPGYTLRRGKPRNSIDDVMRLQMLLVANGRLCAMDGRYSREIEKAVIAVQTELSATESGKQVSIDGKVGGDIWNRLVEQALRTGKGPLLLDLHKLDQSRRKPST